MVKGYYECSFAVGVGQKFLIKKKRGDPVMRVTDDCRGQLEHLNRELVSSFAFFPVLIEFIDFESLKQ